MNIVILVNDHIAIADVTENGQTHREYFGQISNSHLDKYISEMTELGFEVSVIHQNNDEGM